MPLAALAAAPPGYESVAVADPDWVVLADGEPCTHAGHLTPACGRPGVAGWRPYGTRRWAYCAEHLYGCWIEGGRVMRWTLRRLVDDSDAEIKRLRRALEGIAETARQALGHTEETTR